MAGARISEYSVTPVSVSLQARPIFNNRSKQRSSTIGRHSF